jgi:peptide-methionine (R)-S-oxide reductase
MNKPFDSGPDVCGPVGCAVGDKIDRSKEEWQSQLTDEEYRVLRQQGTERAFTSPLYLEKREGTYVCAGCEAPLFDSSTKYESGTGWPSFFQALEGSVETEVDHQLGMARTEYHCARCGGHHGHVFPDGPRPTGLRYCNNGVSLKFVPRDARRS